MNVKKIKAQTEEAKKIIKKEKVDLYPLSHYIDDRIELNAQIFASLKPKTIKNLAPDFLKNATIDDIQELCSTELLGISTKRLFSIINAQKCPSDTESSDSEKIEEHISLEEISSDSEDGNTRKLQDKKKRKKLSATNSQDNNKNPKEISVLELLELQARARAIRSQLALEPIAKIEVDSDDSTKSTKSQTVEKPSESTRKRHSNNHSDETQQTGRDKKSTNGTVSESSIKRIKLKRNFRRTNKSPEDEDRVEESTLDENSTTKCNNDFKKEKSLSPDVITILPSPETLCISDSSDEECKTQNTNPVPEKLNVELVEEKVNKEDKENHESDIEEGEILDKDDQEKVEDEIQNEDETKNKSETLQNEERLEDVDVDKEIKSKSSLEENSNEAHNNDDVISLEHEELDDEGKENIDGGCISPHLEKNGEDQNLTVQNSEPKDTEHSSESVPCIELDDDSTESCNEHEEKEGNAHGDSTSWNFRWLKSSKVSRVLAVSKLGNRVRDKIRQKKKSDQDQVEPSGCSEDVETYLSNFEDGSIQQYHDILSRENSSSKEQ